MPVTKQMWMSAAALVVAVIFFGVSGTDIWVQNHFYNPVNHQWILDREDPVLNFIFYDGIKRLIIIVNVLVLIALVVWWKKPFLARYRKGLIIVLLSSIFVPIIVGSFKATTNIPCPKNLEIYGGIYPHTCVWEKYPSTFCNQKKIKCWPAGHASGGFALLSLFYLFRKRRAKIIALSGVMVVGWSMGTYKMLIGDHFLSHTVITMIMAWLIISIIVALLSRLERRGVIAF
ncbi:phosphoesterase PA-phosphatase-like protein [Sulfuricurvum kujiense DSM 16994]|uniref:Phosphoesterase PA-phosphatase-like protein n=1 Tax=Sulfuricurvum kujiense (strain ATCC BAA-921 / DSM 16994 / JCM 11577 / YK-1) TaxID=709032 RepID=E4TXQ9_SULKY|nr:phosphatase PAP2 family protein [Sulfuricurvum kujiense]ADR34995.1 phosphoesterase PA-phosphatase-like protein [Sulfuricurvum kujiense DSM 16994]